MQAGARGKGLVESILAFSRSGLGERVPVHVQSVVEETLEILAASLLPQVRLEKRLDAGDTAVVGGAAPPPHVAVEPCTQTPPAVGPRRGVNPRTYSGNRAPRPPLARRTP